MMVAFGSGKCPVCGNFGRAIKKNIMHCERCNLAFDDFLVTGSEIDMSVYEIKYWN